MDSKLVADEIISEAHGLCGVQRTDTQQLASHGQNPSDTQMVS